MNYEISDAYKTFQEQLNDIVLNFETKGKPFGNQDRNSLKLFELNGKILNVKSFRIPNLVNQIVYKFFRKSKAQRSFEYANKLTELGVKTPQPIAYYEFSSPLLFKESYYLSEQLECDLTFRDLTKDLNYPNHEEILRAFTRFTYELHQKGIHFLDHSPGNTLIKIKEEGYDFYLVDLNRMDFNELDFKTRINNFSKLTTKKSMVETMSNEYAKVSGEDYNKILNLMWHQTESFQEKFHRKRRLKKQLLFWRR